MRNGSQRIAGKLVLMSQVRFGFLGEYNSEVGPSPFERFKLGGDGMQSYQFLQGSDIIGLRGYQNFSIIPVGIKLYMPIPTRVALFIINIPWSCATLLLQASRQPYFYWHLPKVVTFGIILVNLIRLT